MKFSLTTNTKERFGITLYQIKAEMSFGNVEKWDLWWWVEKESNLSQVSGDARVYGGARVYGNAQVYGDAQVYGNARVSGNLKLISWYFFGLRYKKEEIKYVKLDDNCEIICKWDIEVNKEEDKPEVNKMTVKEVIEKLWYEVEIVK